MVTKAVLRAAEHLGVPDGRLARILGLSPATVSRMRQGHYCLDPAQKPFELAVLFLRLYRSLDAIAGGDEEVARAWLRNDNTALAGPPLQAIASIAGMMHVIDYLDARRALV